MANIKINSIWSRVETTPNIAPNYENKIHDPLWLLSRQWQTGEFKAQDTGSPISAKIVWEQQQLKEVSLNNNLHFDYNKNIPLEYTVERIRLKNLSLQIRMVIGEKWLNLLQQNGFIDKIEPYKEKLVFELPASENKEDKLKNAPLLSDSTYMQLLHAAIRGKMLDGGMLYQKLVFEEKTASGLIEESNQEGLDILGKEFIAWFHSHYGQPINDKLDAWKPEQLEYEFATSTVINKQPKIFHAKEYSHGRLDWYAFDLASNENNTTLIEDLDEGSSIIQQQTVIPANLDYPGIPNARWWAFEDNRINFSAIQANTNQIANLAFMQFGLLYSNDWFMLPIQVPYGSICHFKSIVVEDVFGQRTLVKHYTDYVNKEWTFFQHTNHQIGHKQEDKGLFFVPPISMDTMESKAVEHIIFTRDEMANLVWAIEQNIENCYGIGKQGRLAFLEIKEYLEQSFEPETAITIENEAKIKYLMANPVPENWIPFLPEKTRETLARITIKFRRGAVPRIVSGIQPERVRPRTQLLRTGIENDKVSPYFINEEEIPRAGIHIKGSWQRCRGVDGKVYLWYGYRKMSGSGEQNNSFRFDGIVPKG